MEKNKRLEYLSSLLELIQQWNKGVLTKKQRRLQRLVGSGAPNIAPIEIIDMDDFIFGGQLYLDSLIKAINQKFRFGYWNYLDTFAFQNFEGCF